jgi:hypothetical protein
MQGEDLPSGGSGGGGGNLNASLRGGQRLTMAALRQAALQEEQLQQHQAGAGGREDLYATPVRGGAHRAAAGSGAGRTAAGRVPVTSAEGLRQLQRQQQQPVGQAPQRRLDTSGELEDDEEAIDSGLQDFLVDRVILAPRYPSSQPQQGSGGAEAAHAAGAAALESEAPAGPPGSSPEEAPLTDEEAWLSGIAGRRRWVWGKGREGRCVVGLKLPSLCRRTWNELPAPSPPPLAPLPARPAP